MKGTDLTEVIGLLAVYDRVGYVRVGDENIKLEDTDIIEVKLDDGSKKIITLDQLIDTFISPDGWRAYTGLECTVKEG